MPKPGREIACSPCWLHRPRRCANSSYRSCRGFYTGTSPTSGPPLWTLPHSCSIPTMPSRCSQACSVSWPSVVPIGSRVPTAITERILTRSSRRASPDCSQYAMSWWGRKATRPARCCTSLSRPISTLLGYVCPGPEPQPRSGIMGDDRLTNSTGRTVRFSATAADQHQLVHSIPPYRIQVAACSRHGGGGHG